MHKPRGRIVLHKLFPTISPEFKEEFRAYERLIARRIVIAGSLALIVLLPLLQSVDAWVIRSDEPALLRYLLGRTPIFLFAVVILVLWYRHPDGRWPRPAAILLGLALMSVTTARFAYELVTPGIDVADASYLLLIIIAVSAVLTTRGAHDLVLIFGLPTAGFLGFLWYTAPEVGPDVAILVYPAVTMIIAAYIAHVLYGMYTENFFAEQQLRQYAMTDPLTGLLNRRAMDTELAACRDAAHRYGRSFAIVMGDLDHFKRVNDAHGHDVGDQVLAEVSARIMASVRGSDRVSRWGGEEYLVLLQGVDSAAAMSVAEKLRQAVATRAIETSVGALEVTMSFGVGVCRQGECLEDLIIRADEALYRAKQTGRNRCVLAEAHPSPEELA